MKIETFLASQNSVNTAVENQIDAAVYREWLGAFVWEMKPMKCLMELPLLFDYSSLSAHFVGISLGGFETRLARAIPLNPPFVPTPRVQMRLNESLMKISI